jgi:hypothetical protein
LLLRILLDCDFFEINSEFYVMKYFLYILLLSVAILNSYAGSQAACGQHLDFDSLCPTVHDPVMARGDDGRYYIFLPAWGLA